jgi:hypothetical protein
MTTWPSVHQYLLQMYECSADDGDLLQLWVPNGAEDPSATDVIVTSHKGEHSGDWIQADSGYGDLTAKSAAVGFEYVGLPENGGISLGRVGDIATIRWTAFLDGQDDQVMAIMVGAVGWHSHQLSTYLQSEQTDVAEGVRLCAQCGFWPSSEETICRNCGAAIGA